MCLWFAFYAFDLYPEVRVGVVSRETQMGVCKPSDQQPQQRPIEGVPQPVASMNNSAVCHTISYLGIN